MMLREAGEESSQGGGQWGEREQRRSVVVLGERQSLILEQLKENL